MFHSDLGIFVEIKNGSFHLDSKYLYLSSASITELVIQHLATFCNDCRGYENKEEMLIYLFQKSLEGGAAGSYLSPFMQSERLRFFSNK